MANALKQIIAEAKRLYKKGGTWKGAIKKAGAKYRAGKKSPAKKRVPTKAARRKKSGSVKRRRRIGTLSDGPRPASGAISGLSAAHHIAKAKKAIGEQIANAELSKFRAPKKAAKRKISKRIAALKTRYRKLC